jgi:hypothetical protein
MSDPDIKITLPLSMWRVVVAHLEAGTYRDVCHAVAAIVLQTQQQLEQQQLAVAQAEVERLLEQQQVQALQPTLTAEETQALNHKRLN